MITCLGLAPALDVTYGVPEFSLGAIHRPSSTLALAGGKALNVARALRALGGAPRAIVPLGGHIGGLVRDGLEREGIAALVVPAAAATRTCVTIIDDDGTATEVYENAVPVDDAAWAALQSAIAGISDGWIAVSGAIPAARDADLAAALGSAAGRGIRLALDVRGGALHDILEVASPDVVKINRGEAAETFGPGDAAALALRLRGAGARTAIVTDGAAGAVGTDGTGIWRARPPMRGRYAVGSGDSFLAGLLSAMDAGRALPDALRLATAVAVANTLTPGAALFDTAEVARISPLVDVSAEG